VVKMNEQQAKEIRINGIKNEIYNEVAAILIKYDRKEGEEAFKRYIMPFSLQLQLTGKLDEEE